jgi:hypothetical protein
MTKIRWGRLGQAGKRAFWIQTKERKVKVIMNSISRFIHILQISVVAVFILCAHAFADTPARPHDFKRVTENKEYVFVMLAPLGRSNDGSEIRRVYKQSGLYKNDGSTTPRWTVDWYAFEVFPSSDGEHLIRMGPWAGSTDQLALSFHRNGKEIKNYRIKDLVHDNSKLKHTVSHFFWKSELKYDDKEAVLFLKTIDNQAYRFSAKTGEILP